MGVVVFFRGSITGRDKYLFLWEYRSNLGCFFLLGPAFWGQKQHCKHLGVRINQLFPCNMLESYYLSAGWIRIIFIVAMDIVSYKNRYSLKAHKLIGHENVINLDT
jgi:hypothetical protein